jgi:hypothetical protein
MEGRRTLTLLALVIGSTLCGSALFNAPLALYAAPPWKPIISFKKIDADPDNEYPLTEQNGPWVIMATTFTGPDAMSDAKQLVYELRKDFKLPAYTLDKQFDYSKTERGKGVDQYGQPKKMRYQKAEQVNQVAVLVGDYQTVDDPDAQKVLARLKQAQPESLKRTKTSQSLADYRQTQQQGLVNTNKSRGPLGNAFVTTNPMLPKEYFAPQGVDKLVLEMNKDVEHSLLKCAGRYSVKVATFTGSVVLDQSKIKEIEGGKESAFKSQLEQAAIRAHKLTVALRDKGYEAYEFHDRYSSIVTVGSFSTIGTPRADGKTELQPKIYTIMKTFSGEETTGSPGANAAVPGGYKPKMVAGIPLDIQPIPVEVPRRSLATDYQQTSMK